ncbi:DUF1127 domain-containing protein [Rhodovulum sulfidophilum]|uniref:DUF1127 domain-containing protein n=1 Tax=Rhodovulum sulfidophilum TaxID=35806 RepID=A0A0D6B3N8_RHOSU|nr:hypothetical protein [Rhodovulum sulfidophilum]ANB34776.1 hypothetical protein A6W98_12320 [Rhodovulum sulfidophilum DSM 1374]ANB38599.1 hypothetical protein A6024_12185 [Rhodovulum sulfidophilum]MBK5923646.1 hypothetical protein [Rhodovulum sulfidophilum]MBL3550811.1 DUF1127 domain-containing protein [Rhodovulum sulfidophilum]MBL3560886.1 DUF1127 domain-containing protein [Rhodovulum sulfidophilum]
MALANTHVAGPRGSFFSSVIAAMVRMVENHPRTRALDRLNAISDEELAARGLTRQDVIRRIFSDRFYL